MKTYALVIAQSAKDDLERLHSFAADIDPDMAEGTLKTIKSAFEILTRHPHTCRKVKLCFAGACDQVWQHRLFGPV